MKGVTSLDQGIAKVVEGRSSFKGRRSRLVNGMTTDDEAVWKVDEARLTVDCAEWKVQRVELNVEEAV